MCLFHYNFKSASHVYSIKATSQSLDQLLHRKNVSV